MNLTKATGFILKHWLIQNPILDMATASFVFQK